MAATPGTACSRAPTTRRSRGIADTTRSTRSTRSARRISSESLAGARVIATTAKSKIPQGSRKNRRPLAMIRRPISTQKIVTTTWSKTCSS